MPPALTSLDLVRFEAATRTLASPLAFRDVEAWREEVMHALCAVLGAERASFHFPGQEHPHVVRGLDDAARELLDDFLAPAWGDFGAGPDPGLDAFRRIVAERGLEAWDNAYADSVLGGSGDIRRTLFWNEVVVPVRSEDSQSLFVSTPRGAVQLSAFSLRRTPGPGEHLPLLRVLLPTLKAGLDAIFRLDAHRAALDAVAEPLAAFSGDGIEVYRSAPLRGLLASDPEGSTVEGVLDALAQRVRPLAFARRCDTPNVSVPTAEVRTKRARYLLRATLLPPGSLGLAESFLVTVSAYGGAPAFPTVGEVRARYGLTEREAEVALLVARGLSNDEVAERLFVSRHTVRHHVESAMAKLGLTGRGREAVAAHLLGADCLIAA